MLYLKKLTKTQIKTVVHKRAGDPKINQQLKTQNKVKPKRINRNESKCKNGDDLVDCTSEKKACEKKNKKCLMAVVGVRVCGWDGLVVVLDH